MTRRQLVAVLRAEIERDGVHVAVTDAELWEAATSPLLDRQRRVSHALDELDANAGRAAQAMRELADRLTS